MFLKFGKIFAFLLRKKRNKVMNRDQANHISFEQWKELTAKDIFFFYEDDKPKSLSKLYDLFGDEFDEEEHPHPKPKKEMFF